MMNKLLQHSSDADSNNSMAEELIVLWRLDASSPNPSSHMPGTSVAENISGRAQHHVGFVVRPGLDGRGPAPQPRGRVELEAGLETRRHTL